jgi:hypothetical protein
MPNYKLIKDDPRPSDSEVEIAPGIFGCSLIDMCKDARKLNAWYKRRFKHVKRNNTIILYFSYPYEFDLDYVETPAGLLRGVLHLLSKTWFEACDAQKFCEFVANIKGWDLKRLR